MSLSVIPRLPSIYDEPFADPSQIPTFVLSELTRRQVTVSLSGDGGDELFGGYYRYPRGRRVWEKIRRIPRPARVILGRVLSLAPTSLLSVMAWLRGYGRGEVFADRLRKLGRILPVDSQQAFYHQMISTWDDPSIVVGVSREPLTSLTDPNQGLAADADILEQMMYLDLVTYLPDDLLVKVDRASMAVSLEGRMPFLDHNVVELAWQLPMSLKIRGGRSKWLLRQVLSRYVPTELIERPKRGFSVPLAVWLREPLRDWAEDLLDEKRLRQEGYLSPQPIRDYWTQHLSGKRTRQNQLWSVLMFQAWLQSQK